MAMVPGSQSGDEPDSELGGVSIHSGQQGKAHVESAEGHRVSTALSNDSPGRPGRESMNVWQQWGYGVPNTASTTWDACKCSFIKC